MSNVDPLDALRALANDDDEDVALSQCRNQLMNRILVLNEYAWERRLDRDQIERWLSNFTGKTGVAAEIEQVHALYILSQFLYFGVREMRVLLKALYRDLFFIPAIARVRASAGGTRDYTALQIGLNQEINGTPFLGLGNPSESGPHLLYYFRQENGLSKNYFIDISDIFEVDRGGIFQLRDPSVKRYIFVDDVCGSGETAVRYSRRFLNSIKKCNPDITFEYHAIFGTSSGMNEVRRATAFAGNASCIYELDSSFKSLSVDSRNLKSCPTPIHRDTVVGVARFYGELVAPRNGGGFNDDQLLLGFNHNIPDNTLPIIWRDVENGSPISWAAAFKRYMKV